MNNYDRFWIRGMKATTKMNRQGRIVIPAQCRAEAGLKAGDDLIVETVGEGEIRLSTPRHAIKEAQAIVARYRKKGSDPVQELIDERRAEAARE
jgi:AbrB family looped-hinge helix DNA binding protein